MSGVLASPASRRAAIAAASASLLLAARPSALLAACRTSLPDPSLLPHESGRVLRVSSRDPLRSLAATARAARDGDTIEVEPGDYFGDVSVWPQSDLTIRGAGPRPRLIAGGRDAEGKGIMVVRGKRVRIENIEFREARVRDRNGAGIRVENGPLSVSNCVFADNENGILAGNPESGHIAIDSTVFSGNGHPNGQSHNLYVGAIARLDIEGCLFSRSKVGHLLKSRARVSSVRYSRLTCEDGTSSYELEFPNGGQAEVIGNLIQQGPASENSTLVSFGAEGYRWPDSALSMAFNTIVNDRPNGAVFLRVAKGAQKVTLVHNLFVGPGSRKIDAPLDEHGTIEATRKEFSDPAAFDYRLRAKSPLVGRAGFRGKSIDDKTLPMREYEHVATSCALENMTALTPLSPGAFQRLAR